MNDTNGSTPREAFSATLRYFHRNTIVRKSGRGEYPPCNGLSILVKKGPSMPTTAPPTPLAQKQLPTPNSDFYSIYETLNAEELATVLRIREFMEAKVAPIITKY